MQIFNELTIWWSFFSSGGISVHYAVLFENIGPDATAEGTGDADTVSSPSLTDLMSTALSEEATLPIDLSTLVFGPGATHYYAC